MSNSPISDFANYEAFLSILKTRVRTAQLRATLAVNRELVLLYWQIGRDILERQQDEGWGAKVIERATARRYSPAAEVAFLAEGATAEPSTSGWCAIVEDLTVPSNRRNISTHQPAPLGVSARLGTAVKICWPRLRRYG